MLAYLPKPSEMIINMQLPTRKECFAFLEKYHTPQNVISHSLVVNKVAIYLAEQFNKAGVLVDSDLIDRASLLHDIMRLTTLGHHAEEGAKIFTKDYPVMAQVIAKHRLSAIINDLLKTWEEKIVYYADKRVNHDSIVNIAVRMQEGSKRWHVQKSDDQHELILKKMKELEKELFAVIKQEPNIINGL